MKSLSEKNLFHSRRTVARDLIIWLNLAASLTIILIGAAYYYFSTKSLNKSLNDKALETTEEIANVLMLPLFNVDDDAIRHTASVYMATGRLTGIRIESTVNGIVVDSLPVNDITLPRMEKTIAKNGLTLGRVELVFNDMEIRDMQRGTIWITVLTIIAVVIVNAFVIRRIMHFLLIAPLARLTRRIEDIASGAYQGSMAHVPQDDLNKLIVSANRMSEQIDSRTRQLTESEMRYREIFNATSEAIFIHDAETGTILDVNQTMLDMYGYTGEEVLKLKASDLSLATPPYTQEEALQRIRRAVEQGPQLFEWRARRKNGELFWVEVAMSSSEIGGQRRVLAVVRDITERRETEAAIRTLVEGTSELTGQAFFDNLVIKINEWLECDVVLVAELQDKSISRSIAMVADGKKIENYICKLEKTPSGNVVQKGFCHYPENIIKLFPEDRELIDFNLSGYVGTALKDRTGRTAGILCAMSHEPMKLPERTEEIMNIIAARATAEIERKRAEEALRASEQRYRSLVNNIDLAVTLINQDYEIVMTNKALGNFFKKDPGGFIGHKCFKEFEKRGEVCKHCPGRIAMETLRSAQVEALGTRDDGSSFSVYIHAFPVIDSSGKAEGFIEVIEDITDKKHLEEELQRSHRLESIGILAGGIAHDFNNLLTAILTNVYLTKNHVDRESKGYKSLEAAEKASLRAADLTQQLLTFARGGEPVKKTTSIINVIKESAEFVLRGSNVKCEYDIAHGIWPVEVDQGQMSQVVHNLILNADQSMPEGGLISISAENSMLGECAVLPLQEGRYIKIVIRDEGIGIAEEHLQKIFDPYFSTKETGRGLGLSIIYSIIKQHDGYISVESEMSVGTTFTIYIPASRKQIREEKTKDNAIVPGKGKILLMDDEEIIRESLGEMLKVMEYEVEFANNGADAVEIYKKAGEISQPFDAVILDLTVPGGMGGKEAMKKLLEIDPNIKAVVSSGYSNDPVMANYRDYGFSDVITKPYKNPEELGKILNQLILPYST